MGWCLRATVSSQGVARLPSRGSESDWRREALLRALAAVAGGRPSILAAGVGLCEKTVRRFFDEVSAALVPNRGGVISFDLTR